MGQLAVAIPRWHSDYDEKFSPVTKLWVAATRSDGAWLNSLITASPAIREKMRLCVCDDIQVLLGLKVTTDIAMFHGQHVSLDGFYNSYFKPIPENAEQVKALLHPPKPSPCEQTGQPDWRVGGSAGSGGYSGVAIEVPSSGSIRTAAVTGMTVQGFASNVSDDLRARRLHGLLSNARNRVNDAYLAGCNYHRPKTFGESPAFCVRVALFPR